MKSFETPAIFWRRRQTSLPPLSGSRSRKNISMAPLPLTITSPRGCRHSASSGRCTESSSAAASERFTRPARLLLSIRFATFTCSRTDRENQIGRARLAGVVHTRRPPAAQTGEGRRAEGA